VSCLPLCFSEEVIPSAGALRAHPTMQNFWSAYRARTSQTTKQIITRVPIKPYPNIVASIYRLAIERYQSSWFCIDPNNGPITALPLSANVRRFAADSMYRQSFQPEYGPTALFRKWSKSNSIRLIEFYN
jgi:hypothetical protein